MLAHQPFPHARSATGDHDDFDAAAVNFRDLFADGAEASEGGAPIVIGYNGGSGFDEDAAGVAEGCAGFWFFTGGHGIGLGL